MREYRCINEEWIFEKEGMSSENISLPHTWNAIDGQDGGNDYYRGTCVYKKILEKPSINQNDQVYLEFRGANSSAEVKVNGTVCGNHDGGYSTFRVNITNLLKDVNEIQVSVDNGPNKRVYPQKADFTFYGGIYRDVYLIIVPETHFDLDLFGAPGIMVTPEVQTQDASVKIKTFIKGNYDSVKVTIDGIGNAQSTINGNEAEGVITIPNVHLWNGLEDPYLYEAKAELIVNGEVIDTVSAKFGCRTYSFDKDQGFILNGKPYPLHGVSRHQDRRGVGNALTTEMQDEDMSIILDMGANSIRLAHYQHNQYFYDLCDEKGVVVWAEIPYISEHLPEGRDNTISQMTELVLQNYNHPSIVCWALSNEITAAGVTDDIVENHKILNDLVHELDSSRVTAMANVFMLETSHPIVDIPDIMSYNLYYGWYIGKVEDNDTFFDEFHEKYPDKIIGLAEYGADTFYKLQSPNPEKGDYSQQYQCIYHEHMLELFHKRPYLWSTYVWNMFDFGADGREEAGDNGVNHKGLVTFDRKIKKDAYFIYKAWWSKEAFVHVCGKEYVDRVEEITEVKVYSNLDKVALYKDGELLEEKQGSHVFVFQVPISGTHRIEARSGEYISIIEVNKADKPNPVNYLESTSIHNWFEDEDLAVKPGYFSVQDTMGDIKSVPEGKALMDAMNAHALKARGDVAQNVQLGEAIERMMNQTTVIDMMKHAGGAITPEMLIELNKRLTQIKKPEK